MAQVLTKKRETWAVTRGQEHVFKGKGIQNNAAVEQRYSANLQKLVREMHETTLKEIRKLFGDEEFSEELRALTTDASIASQARILLSKLTNQFSKLFAQSAKPTAEKMINDADKASASATHESLKELSGGLSIKTSQISPKLNEILKASVAENVSLIKSIQSKYFEQIQGYVMRSIVNQSYSGIDKLTRDIQGIGGITQRRAKNIALDQTRKVYNTMNSQRLKDAGIKAYIWRHSKGGANPREDHLEMDGKTFYFDKPPIVEKSTGDRGIPGTAINCKCFIQPIYVFNDKDIDEDDTRWADEPEPEYDYDLEELVRSTRAAKKEAKQTKIKTAKAPISSPKPVAAKPQPISVSPQIKIPKPAPASASVADPEMQEIYKKVEKNRKKYLADKAREQTQYTKTLNKNAQEVQERIEKLQQTLSETQAPLVKREENKAKIKQELEADYRETLAQIERDYEKKLAKIKTPSEKKKQQQLL